ncbi:hypothetical protein BCD67_25635 [Oscillatoriales cyanobacterium USR001]|nr:hypothetical protein BCD67_25635 [Oscillatoriales cyanobacterium USR001]
MGSRKPIYRIKSTGQLVIEQGFDIKVTPSQAQGTRVFELLNESRERTGNIVPVLPDDLEEADK